MCDVCLFLLFLCVHKVFNILRLRHIPCALNSPQWTDGPRFSVCSIRFYVDGIRVFFFFCVSVCRFTCCCVFVCCSVTVRVQGEGFRGRRCGAWDTQHVTPFIQPHTKRKRRETLSLAHVSHRFSRSRQRSLAGWLAGWLGCGEKFKYTRNFRAFTRHAFTSACVVCGAGACLYIHHAIIYQSLGVEGLRGYSRSKCRQGGRLAGSNMLNAQSMRSPTVPMAQIEIDFYRENGAIGRTPKRNVIHFACRTTKLWSDTSAMARTKCMQYAGTRAATPHHFQRRSHRMKLVQRRFVRALQFNARII